MVVTRGVWAHDHVALAEIEMCGDLMIAASAAAGERLSSAMIDEVLKVDRGGECQALPAALAADVARLAAGCLRSGAHEPGNGR